MEKKIDQGAILKNIKNTVQLEQEAIHNLFNSIDDSVVKAAELIYKNTTGKLIVTGVGKSGLIAQKIVATMISTGTVSHFLHPNDAMHGDFGLVEKHDIIIMISKSGESDELINLLPILGKLQSKIISITANKQSTLAQNSFLHLYTPIEKEACALDLAPTCSTTAALVLGDALAVAVMTLKNFQKQDFAFSHPAGRLGKRLIYQVKDIMRSGNEHASVKKQATISEILDAFSRGGTNSVTVLNEDQTLAGAITSYDLRKAIKEKQADFINLMACDLLQQHPKTIDQTQLAFDAFQIMTQHDRTLNFLIVMDQLHPVGIVTLQDLIKLGL